MPRYALQIEYDGKPYHGWQRQRDLPSVQETIEIAISKVAPEKPEIQGAGRTDRTLNYENNRVVHRSKERRLPRSR